MGAKKQSLKKKRSIVYYLILLLPSLSALMWSAWPAFSTLVATFKFEPIVHNKTEWDFPQTSEKVRRSIQMHFLKNRLYVPMDDIIIVHNDSDPDEKKLLLMMSKSCGNARIYVWLPLSVRLPFIGYRVWEWCWKPTVKIKN